MLVELLLTLLGEDLGPMKASTLGHRSANKAKAMTYAGLDEDRILDISCFVHLQSREGEEERGESGVRVRYKKGNATV